VIHGGPTLAAKLPGTGRWIRSSIAPRNFEHGAIAEIPPLAFSLAEHVGKHSDEGRRLRRLSRCGLRGMC
jgi:hypothetical protein